MTHEVNGKIWVWLLPCTGRMTKLVKKGDKMLIFDFTKKTDTFENGLNLMKR